MTQLQYLLSQSSLHLIPHIAFKIYLENSLAVQWLGLHVSTSGGTGSIPDQGTKIPHAM